MSLLAAGLCAGVVTLAVMIAWPDVQPVILGVVGAIGATISPGGNWLQDSLEHLVIPGLPIVAPILTFIFTFIAVHRRLS